MGHVPLVIKRGWTTPPTKWSFEWHNYIPSMWDFFIVMIAGWYFFQVLPWMAKWCKTCENFSLLLLILNGALVKITSWAYDCSDYREVTGI